MLTVIVKSVHFEGCILKIASGYLYILFFAIAWLDTSLKYKMHVNVSLTSGSASTDAWHAVIGNQMTENGVQEGVLRNPSSLSLTREPFHLGRTSPTCF